MKYKLNSGKIISGYLKKLSFIKTDYIMGSTFRALQVVNRNARSSYTKALHGGYLVRIYLTDPNHNIVICYYDWCDQQLEFKEWVKKHIINTIPDG